VETKPRARDARTELVARRQTARPRLLRREREAAAVFAPGSGELRVRERDRAVSREPRSEFVPPFELETVTTRRFAHFGGAVVSIPGRLVIKIEEPAGGGQVEPVPETRARSDFFAHGTRERRDRRGREDASHVVRMKPVSPVEIHIE